MSKKKSLFKIGLKEGFPIGLGYFPLAFTLGIAGTNMGNMGLKLIHSLAMALLSFTGVGQLTTLNLMKAHETHLMLFLSLLVINLRHIVLSLILSQRLDPKTTFGQKLILAMGNTDEIFALTIRKEGKIPFNYFFGVMTVPYLAWAMGVLIGGIAGDILPHNVMVAMNMALYAMLISAVVPAAKESKAAFCTAALAGVISSVMYWVKNLIPQESIFSGLFQSGGTLIIGSLVSAAIAALIFPKNKEESSNE